MTSFEERLKKAIQRGHRRGDAQAREAAERAMSEDELRRLHSQYRLQLSEHIESCIGKLPAHFPGFEVEMIYGERGWGAACRRDDVNVVKRRRRENLYSRLEIIVRPYNSLSVLDIAAKGTVHNRELFNRQHYTPLAEVDIEPFLQLVDTWALEFAELYSANQ